MPLKPETLLESVRRLVPKKTVEINMKAFEMGRDRREGLMERRLGAFEEDTLYEGDALGSSPDPGLHRSISSSPTRRLQLISRHRG